MSRPSERLYQLLPSVLRARDATAGEPLRALMAILETELARIEDETDTTWDDWFIETCQEWVVPYLGEALGVKGMRSIEATGFSQRAYVANTLAYRRRKGTAAVLEQLARDLTGHGARVVEYFERTAVSPHHQHIRSSDELPTAIGTVHLGDALALERLGGPFGQEVHTAEVGSIRSAPGHGQGRWNLPNIGLHLFALSSDAIVRSEARAMAGETLWYHVDPHGRDMPLFTLARSEDSIGRLAGPEHVARPLSRRELADEERGTLPASYLSPDAIVRVRMLEDDGTERIFSAVGDLVEDTDSDGIPDVGLPPVEVAPGDERPRLRIAFLETLAGGLPTRRPAAPGICHLDPELGRLVFHLDERQARDDLPEITADPPVVLVDYAMGFLAEVGAGVHDRSEALTDILDLDTVTVQWGVSATEHDGSEVFATLGDAIAAWNDRMGAITDPSGETGLIVVTDNRAHGRTDGDGVDQEIELPKGARLYIVAAGWPDRPLAGSATANRLRPVVLGDLVVHGQPGTTEGVREGGLWLEGLSIEEGVVVSSGALERLHLGHCTLANEDATIAIGDGADGGNEDLSVTVVRSLLRDIASAGPVRALRATDSAFHGQAVAIELPGAELSLGGCTLLGTVAAHSLEATDCIFTDPLTIEHTQVGCVRFSYVEPGSRTPRRFRCQPDRALDGITDPAERVRVESRLRPGFTTRHQVQPAYLQLSQATPEEVARGGEDRTEPGLFHHIQLPWRHDNLRTALRQYLRHGLEAGLLSET